MAIFKLALAAGAGYALYRMTRAGPRARRDGPVAFASGEDAPGWAPVRNAGPEAMASNPGAWDRIDEAADESFPASDPPAIPRIT